MRRDLYLMGTCLTCLTCLIIMWKPDQLRGEIDQGCPGENKSKDKRDQENGLKTDRCEQQAGTLLQVLPVSEDLPGGLFQDLLVDLVFFLRIGPQQSPITDEVYKPRNTVAQL